MFDTIVALATAPFKGALAIIRISGDKSLDIVKSIFSRDIKEWKSHTVYYGNIINGDEIIDEVLVTYFKGPKSFTAEDSVEISCHGSMLIANQIIELIISKGARLAERGEFTSRAFYNGRIDLVQAEAVNELINATTLEAKKLSLLSVKGEASKILVPIKNALADILANIEVNIDYPEYEDIEVMTNKKIIEQTDKIIHQIDKVINEGKKNTLVINGIKVAIVGKPNVGKSSLLNALLNYDKAIVTNIPGTTRDVVEGQVNLNGITLNLLDTAGIRESDNLVEKIGIDKSKRMISEADLVLLVLDASSKLEDEDYELLESTKDMKRIVVYNKKDLIKDNNHPKGVYISAMKKDIKPLEDEIIRLFNFDELSNIHPSLCSPRELGLLLKAKENLKSAYSQAKNNISLDLISVDLKASYDAIRDILGEEIHPDLESEIFARFCVGK